MRLLFALLLLANAALLAWTLLAAEPAEQGATRQAPAGDLVLLAESRDDSTAEPGQAPERCLEAGPLQDKGMSAAIQNALRRADIRFSLVEKPRLEPLGYWVYIAPAATLDAAQETGRQLRRKGVDNFVYVVGAEKANAISLGLFATESEASALASHIRELGFQPRTEQRYSRQLQHYLVVRSESDVPRVPGAPDWQEVDCQPTAESLP